MSVQMVGSWTRAAEQMARVLHRDVAIGKALGREALMHERDIKVGITTQSPGGKRFRRISFFTRVKRRASGFSGTKALIVNSDLRNSIRTIGPIGRTDWFVGVKRGALSNDGTSLVDVGMINEFGHPRPIVINVDKRGKNGKTPRDYFFALFLKGLIKNPLRKSTKTLVIRRIPPRPFLRPVQEKHKPGQEQRVMDSIFRELGLDS